MATIDVPVHPDRSASIRAGIDPGTTSVPVDLDAITQAERDLLADHDATPVAVTTPTTAALFDALRTTADQERAELDTILDAHRAILRQRRVRTWRNETKPNGVKYDVVQPDWPNPRSIRGRDRAKVARSDYLKVREITESEDARAWAEELEATNQRAREAAWAQQQELDQQEALERERSIDRLRCWATEHGSERVRLLIEESLGAWCTVAEDEFFETHTPHGFVPVADNQVDTPLPAPTATEIHALRAARETAAADPALSNVRLALITTYVTHEPKRDHTAVGLDITAPHGASLAVWETVTLEPVPGEEPFE